MAALAFSPLLPMWQHRLEAVLAVLRGEPGNQVADRFRMTRSDLYKFRGRALNALRRALLDQPRGPKQPHNRLSPQREQAVVDALKQHPTWSARQICQLLGEEAPHPRTIERIRRRHGLTRQLKRPAAKRMANRFTFAVKAQARQAVKDKSELGSHRLAWDLRNEQGIEMSPSTMKRIKKAVRIEADPPPVPPPSPNWLFYERHPPP